MIGLLQILFDKIQGLRTKSFVHPNILILESSAANKKRSAIYIVEGNVKIQVQ